MPTSIDVTAGAQVLHTPISNHKSLLTGLCVTVDDACEFQIEDADENIIAGPWAFSSGDKGIVLPYNPDGWARCAGVMSLVTTGAGRVSGVATTRNSRS